MWILGVTAIILAITLYTKWYIDNVSPIKVSQTLLGVAYMEEDPFFERPVRFQLNGYYDRRRDYFSGAVRINDREYANCFLYNGMQVIGYGEAERLVYEDGLVYMDKGLNRIFWSSMQKNLPAELGNASYPEAQVLLAAPASARSEAAQLRAELEKAFISELIDD